MRIKSLTIKNCRGISSLAISPFAQVNLLGGRNNCGKSTVLEAISLLSMRRDASVIPTLNAIVRRLPLLGLDAVVPMFGDIRFPMEISACIDTGAECHVSACLKDSPGGVLLASEPAGDVVETSKTWVISQQVKDVVGDKVVRAVDLAFEAKLDKNEKMTFPYTSQKRDDGLDWNNMFITANTRYDTGVSKRFAAATVALQDKEIVQTLARIYPDVLTVRLVDDAIMAKMQGYERLLPLSVAGDGVIRIFGVLCGLWACKGGCLCIDEIDNGLHYSALLPFWRAVMDFSVRYDVQLFATTHHLDALETLNVAAKESGSMSKVAYFRISGSKSAGHSAAYFSGKDLDRAIKLGFELRG